MENDLMASPRPLALALVSDPMLMGHWVRDLVRVLWPVVLFAGSWGFTVVLAEADHVQGVIVHRSHTFDHHKVNVS